MQIAMEIIFFAGVSWFLPEKTPAKSFMQRGQDIASFWKRLNWYPFCFLLLCSSKCEFSHEIFRRFLFGHDLSFTSYTWNLPMNGAGTAPLKLALIFTILLFSVLIEAWRTEISFRYGWDELTKHNQSHTNGSMNFVSPLWRTSHILITCAQSSVKSQIKWPELNSFHALGKIMNRNHN